MRRVILATAGVAVVAFVAAALGSAQTTATTGAARAEAKAPVLPKLPAEIANRKRLIAGVKCDTPPFGYLDVRGKNAGVDVEIARQFARYAFGTGQRLTFVCAPTAVREPLLTSNRVDLVISTFTYTADRDTRIDFSRPYYNASGRLLVKNDSPIQRLADIARQARGDHERLDLRPLDEAVLHQHRRSSWSTASRTPCSPTTRAARTPSCSTTRRWRSSPPRTRRRR